jgi:hypothetical protein
VSGHTRNLLLILILTNSNSTIGNIMCSVQRLRLVSKLISRRKRKSSEFAIYNLCQLYIWLIKKRKKKKKKSAIKATHVAYCPNLNMIKLHSSWTNYEFFFFEATSTLSSELSYILTSSPPRDLVLSGGGRKVSKAFISYCHFIKLRDIGSLYKFMHII